MNKASLIVCLWWCLSSQRLIPRIQGKWAFTDPKFIDILRDQLGFDGSIMTEPGLR